MSIKINFAKEQVKQDETSIFNSTYNWLENNGKKLGNYLEKIDKKELALNALKGIGIIAGILLVLTVGVLAAAYFVAKKIWQGPAKKGK